MQYLPGEKTQGTTPSGEWQCDLRRPFCRKCAKAKRRCAGYDRGGPVFVNRTASDPSTSALSVLSLASRAPSDFLQNAEVDLQQRFISSETDHYGFRGFAVRLLEATYLPKHVDAESQPSAFSWVSGLKDLTRPSRSLDAAVFALCQTQLHIAGVGSASSYERLESYNFALQYLTSDLGTPEKGLQEETLAAILALSTQELFICPRQGGWAVHARGVAQILRLRALGGADKHTSAWRHLTTRLRIFCTLEALTRRQGQIFLDNGIWCQIVNESGLNSALDEVYHMIAGVPTVLGQAATLPSITERQILSNEASTVVQRLMSNVTTIDSWLRSFLGPSPTSKYIMVQTRTDNPADEDGKIFPDCFEFESLNVAILILKCWAVKTQLYSNVIQIYDLVQSRLGYPVTLEAMLTHTEDTALASDTSNTLLEPKTVVSINDVSSAGGTLARNICQSLEYFHRLEMGTFGGQSTTYACWSARQYFRLHDGFEREGAWLQNISHMKGPGTRWGVSMMRFADISEPLSGSRGQMVSILPPRE